MTENNFGHKNNDKNNDVELEKNAEKEKNKQQQQCHTVVQKDQQPKTEQHDSRFRRLSQFLDLLNIPRHHSGHSGSSSSSNNSQQHSPQTPHAASEMTATERRNSNSSNHNTNIAICSDAVVMEQEQQQQHHLQYGTTKRSSCVSFRSEILLFDLVNGEINELTERSLIHKDDFGTQRVYKKNSPNCVLTMYLPSREIILSGKSASVLSGIVYVDPKIIQGYRVYAQLTLTFRYGREDEEVMGLRFCNEAIMSLHQIWPKKEEPNKTQLSPLQEALLKRLGDGAHPFTLTLTAQAPPSVQLVPAKRYYGAPIGTSYDVRCFIADKIDEKFNRRTSVRMGVRVIYRTDVYHQTNKGPENFADIINKTGSSPPVTLACTNTHTTTSQATESSALIAHSLEQSSNVETASSNCNDTREAANKPRKSERGDSFPKLRLSPKSFRFSGRFGRSKSEVDKCSNDAFCNYSKSFQEYDSVCPISCGGPQGAVDKPFLLQDGRVGLRASLDKAWYTHGENVCVTIIIRNDSRKTVRKIRVCAIQHVDVCMFNNGKFKNVVADSDNIIPSPFDHQVAPGATLNTTVILRPHRGPTKNWIALEDTLQRSTEPDEINASIAASAVRTPHFLMQANQSPNNCSSPPVFVPATAPVNATNDERNVFAIYVSYYVKVKLTLSGMGGELTLKLPFMLVHIDEEQRQLHILNKSSLETVPLIKKNGHKNKNAVNEADVPQGCVVGNNLDRIESVDEANLSNKLSPLHVKDTFKGQSAVRENDEDPALSQTLVNERRHIFKRSETLAKDLEAEEEENIENNEINEKTENDKQLQVVAQVHNTNYYPKSSSLEDKDLGLADNKIMFEKICNKSSSDDIETISDKLDNKQLNETSLATTVALKTGPNGV